MPTWNGQSKDLGFVDPAKYGTPSADQMPALHGTILNDTQPAVDEMVTYATIKGQYPGTTDTLHIPFPHWQIVYTVDPWAETFVGNGSSQAAGVADLFGTEVFPILLDHGEGRRSAEPDYQGYYAGGGAGCQLMEPGHRIRPKTVDRRILFRYERRELLFRHQHPYDPFIPD